MFLKKIFFLNWSSRGVNSGVAQFHMQFTHVSRQFGALSKKTVLKMWSQIRGSIAMLVHGKTLKKVQKSKKTHKT